jgi:hypothetical protein
MPAGEIPSNRRLNGKIEFMDFTQEAVMQDQSNRTTRHLAVRSHLHAGGLNDMCLGWDTNCIAVDTRASQLRSDLWNNCGSGMAFAGKQCWNAVIANKDRDHLTCSKC